VVKDIHRIRGSIQHSLPVHAGRSLAYWRTAGRVPCFAPTSASVSHTADFILMQTPCHHDSAAQRIAVAADRFAREILAFLKSSCAARLRQLNGNPLGCVFKPVPARTPDTTFPTSYPSRISSHSRSKNAFILRSTRSQAYALLRLISGL
jgi:hypothetical protein